MNWEDPSFYDIIVVGGGHAGCEAALASARMGASTLLLTLTIDSIAKMSCNPAIGGTAKGQIVREIDALGGEMGKVADATAIQYRMLNDARGPAVWSPRSQNDRYAYQDAMRFRLEQCDGLHIKQGSAETILTDDQGVTGILTKEGIIYRGKAVILSSGTFMRGLIHIGEKNLEGGRAGDAPAIGISKSLLNLGHELDRLKTGTPPRIHSRSIDYSLTEEQPGMKGVQFSFDPPKISLPKISCHITYTNAETKKIIEDNLHRSPMYSGKIESKGPRYCPSIEDKIVRFNERDRHQIFLEPEGLTTCEVYANGISSSLPIDVQMEFVRSIPALRNAEITRCAYAIEYDYVTSGQIDFTLESRHVPSLYLAGQINGTTGYEEAAGQGLLAAVNAVRKIRSEAPFILSRSDAYLGVMVDDLVTKGVGGEPYRMFTSRAEHRLLLRQDNADLRLTEKGYTLGLIDETRYATFIKKRDLIAAEKKRLSSIYKNGQTLNQLLCRPENNYNTLREAYPDDIFDYSEEINFQIEMVKYDGYISRQEIEVEKLKKAEKVLIPPSFNFEAVPGLRSETRQKLLSIRPHNLGQASRIPGVTPADISILMVALK